MINYNQSGFSLIERGLSIGATYSSKASEVKK